MRIFIVLTLALACAPALAQNSEPKLKQLEMDGSRGYAVVVDTDGHEHHCDARLTREAVDLGPCRPLRLVTPLINTPEPERPATTTGASMRETVIALFEKAGCSISYSDLEKTLLSVSDLRRQAVGRVIAEMTERGEIADDRARERAVLKTGTRCR